MKKRLNLFCVLMLLLMAIQVVMTFVMGADAFMEGWEKGRDAAPANTWAALFEFFICMFGIAAAIVSFVSFIRFILNVNRNNVFVWQNVLLLLCSRPPDKGRKASPRRRGRCWTPPRRRPWRPVPSWPGSGRRCRSIR